MSDIAAVLAKEVKAAAQDLAAESVYGPIREELMRGMRDMIAAMKQENEDCHAECELMEKECADMRAELAQSKAECARLEGQIAAEQARGAQAVAEALAEERKEDGTDDDAGMVTALNAAIGSLREAVTSITAMHSNMAQNMAQTKGKPTKIDPKAYKVAFRRDGAGTIIDANISVG